MESEVAAPDGAEAPRKLKFAPHEAEHLHHYWWPAGPSSLQKIGRSFYAPARLHLGR